ncbi:hypothetical protein TARUN_10271 [Trichoderma arundinaceum]|uniref:Uncharacterized protein n=1 Tax=Trichoderma arundinaceum TaxID=490622 RepID=A0A395N797_TRIAR|nr:hypothetical protein TARUN_10271 [Trichoderma arundinaceum]
MAGSNGYVPELADDADDDEALRYAIALSLQEQDNSTAATAVVIDDSEDDDETASSSMSTQQTQSQSQSQLQSQATSQSQSQSQFGSLQLDRKAMEQERLKRLAKRQRPSSDDNDDDDVIEIPPPKKQARTPLESNDSKTAPPLPSPRLPYPNGAVKRTWARGCAKTGDEITIEEVFQKEQLELAVLSSFQWDEEWMISKLDFRRTKILLLAFAKDEAQVSLPILGIELVQPPAKSVMRANVPANIKFCFPPMHGFGSMHSKLQLLKFPTHLRVVIPTGNLVPYDWGETGVMENVVYFLQATGVGEKMVASLSNYDFSKTSDIGFVHTMCVVFHIR